MAEATATQAMDVDAKAPAVPSTAPAATAAAAAGAPAGVAGASAQPGGPLARKFWARRIARLKAEYTTSER